MALNKSLEEVKVDRDEATVVFESLKFEHEKLSRMAKEETEGRLKVETEREVAIKALEEEEERVDQKAAEERIKKEAYDLARADAAQEILEYGMGFRRSALFMIREKYPDLDLSDVDLTEIRGYDKPDPAEGSDQQKDQDAEEDAKIVAGQIGEGRTKEKEMLIM